MKKRGVRVVSEPHDCSVCRAMQRLEPDGNFVILHKCANGTFGPESHVG